MDQQHFEGFTPPPIDADEFADEPAPNATERGNWLAWHRDTRWHRDIGAGQPVKPANPRKGAFSRFEAWFDMAAEAAYCERDVKNQGIKQRLDRGQIMGSLTWWARRWNWTVKQVRGFFLRLQRLGMIAIAGGHTPPCEKGTRRDKLCSVITICNYDRYQSASAKKGRAKGTAQPKKGQEKKQLSSNNTPLPLAGQGANDEIETGYEAVRQAYPKARKFTPHALGLKLYRKAIKVGATPETLLAAARRFAVQARGTEPQFVMALSRWLDESHWQAGQSAEAGTRTIDRASLGASNLPPYDDREQLEEMHKHGLMVPRIRMACRTANGWPPDVPTPTSGTRIALHDFIASVPGFLEELERDFEIEWPPQLRDMAAIADENSAPKRATATVLPFTGRGSSASLAGGALA